jgi:hypothetical protein
VGQSAECHYTECCYCSFAECHYTVNVVFLSVNRLSVVVLIFVTLSVEMVIVFMLSVIMPNGTALNAISL